MTLPCLLRYTGALARNIPATTGSTHAAGTLLLRKKCSVPVRFQTTDECTEKPVPKCGVLFKSSPCDAKKQMTAKSVIKQAMSKSLPGKEQEIKIKRSEYCCGNPCSHALPRFDLIYYRRSDKLNRNYQQTWAECPDKVIKPKTSCLPEYIIYPKLPKRSLKERPKTASKSSSCLDTTTTCSRTVVPGCRAARLPPKCHENRKPKKCTKRKAPYPSLSECGRKLPKPCRPVECKCLAVQSKCDVWAQYHKLNAVKAKKKH